MIQRSFLFLFVVLLVGACGKNTKRLTGWTDERVTKSIDTCVTSLGNATSTIPSDKVRPICECWTDALALRFEFDTYDTADAETTKEAVNLGLQCMDDNGVDTNGTRLNAHF